MSAKERKKKTKVRKEHKWPKRAQKSAKERENCKQPGFRNNQVWELPKLSVSCLSLGRVPVCPWDDCPAKAVKKCSCVVFIGFFFAPKFSPGDKRAVS